MLTKEKKQEIVKEFGRSENDNGSCEVQIAFLTERIKQLSTHLKSFPKDKHSQRGLLKLVGARKTFIAYLKRKDAAKYEQIRQKLHLKK